MESHSSKNLLFTMVPPCLPVKQSRAAQKQVLVVDPRRPSHRHSSGMLFPPVTPTLAAVPTCFRLVGPAMLRDRNALLTSGHPDQSGSPHENKMPAPARLPFPTLTGPPAVFLQYVKAKANAQPPTFQVSQELTRGPMACGCLFGKGLCFGFPFCLSAAFVCVGILRPPCPSSVLRNSTHQVL